MSGLPLPSQWVANPGNSELQVEDTVTVCVCVCVCVFACVCVLSCTVMSNSLRPHGL